MTFQNIAVILHFATPAPLTPEQATSAVSCFLKQQGACEPLPVSWDIGVPVEAEVTAGWVKALSPPPPSHTPSSPHEDYAVRKDAGWLD